MARTPNLTPEQKEIVLLHIVGGMGGTADASESKWNWLNWFCNDETGDQRSDTFNRCIEKGWLTCSHDTSFDTSTAYLTEAGRQALATQERPDGTR